MYHVINPPPAGAPYPGLYVPSSEFLEQMLALRQAGFHPVTLDDLWANWRHGDRLPSKPIVITFDNGYRSQYTNAMPILRRLHWTAVLNTQLTGLPPSQGGLTTAQFRGLLAAGWELDTQGISHADLVNQDAAGLRYQIVQARRTLQRRFHVPLRWFCYPSGQYDATVIDAVRAAGFVGSTTVVPGWASRSDSLYALPRLRVLGGTSGSELLAQIAAARQDPVPPGSYATS
jgi:peptidoglycan/xylan/chitin deacetylase (PgdA/CDA1 family)